MKKTARRKNIIMRDIRQTKEYATFLASSGWIVEKVDASYIFIKKVPILGYTIKVQRPQNINFLKIRQLSTKYHPYQTIIEPLDETIITALTDLGYKTATPYLPSKTIHLDLEGKDLINKFKKDARSAIRKAEKLEIITYGIFQIEEFRNIWRQAIGFKRHIPSYNNLFSLKRSFGNNALFITTKDKSAGAVFLYSDQIAYYWHAFTNITGRKQSAQYKIVWEGIKWAKIKGAKIFDFEGIYDERFPDPSWQGFTHFKKSFGGHEVIYPGAYVLKKSFSFPLNLIFNPNKLAKN